MTTQANLSEKIFKNWQKTKTIFKLNEARDWVNKGPQSESAAHLLQWAENHPFIKTKRTDIPETIFPHGAAAIIDIAVMPPRRKKGMKILDDDIFDAYPLVRTYVPRGMTVLELKRKDTGALEHHLVVYAIKKFTGGPGDDDDQEDAIDEGEVEDASEVKTRWEHYFIEPANTATELFSTSKENGEASHMSQFRFEDKLYYIFGSKTVHLMANTVEQIELYSGGRFDYAKAIAKSMLNYVNQMDQKKIAKFLDYMWQNKLTATFEFLQIDHQHIEFFPFQHNEFRFIAFSSNVNLKTLCEDDLEKSIAIAAEAGFMTVILNKYKAADMETMFQTIRGGYGKEGSVIYYKNGSGKVIGLVKKKTVWYIMVRAIREKAKGFCGRMQTAAASSPDMVFNCKKKIRQMCNQKQAWLGFSDTCKQQWEALAGQFIEFLEAAVIAKKLDIDTVRNNFPIAWQLFLKEKKANDHIATQ